MGLFSFLRADEDGADIRLEAPDGWRGETISLPPDFAPGMKLRGVEKIRFAPRMFNPKSDTFFSYVFVFRLGQKENLSLEVVEREILVYIVVLRRRWAGKESRLGSSLST